jgi:hypothetical protein
MREFFYDLLLSLDKMAGLKQYEKLMMTNDPAKEINDLLDILCRTSDTFPLIPKNDQKSILRHAVVSDGDFIGLNAKFVYKSLNAHRERYFREAAHIPDEHDPNWKPLEGEERQKWLEKWKDTLNQMQDSYTAKSHVQELVERLPPKEKGMSHPSTSPERVQQILDHTRELQIKALRDKHPRASDEEINQILTKL